jgi:2-methylisocitrate lyase-like PEP mutase family enzyme
VLVARADGILQGSYDIEEALRRLAAFDAAGADCLYAPLPKTLADQARICGATTKPVNVLIAGPYAKETRAAYAAMGAARLSLGSSLARITHRAIFDAAEAMFGAGDFTPLLNGVSGAKIDKLLA